MNASRFDSVVENRAIERVTLRVAAFRAEVIAAITKLDPSQYPQFSPSYNKHDHGWWPGKLPNQELAVILGNVAKGLTFDEKKEGQTEFPRLKWPRSLFEREREAVQKELLATMDEMQRALIAPAPTAQSEAAVEEVPA